MKLVFYLSGENLELAREEVLALASSKDCSQHGRLLVLRSKPFDFKRLAFTKKVLKLIFISGLKDVEKNIKKINWQRYYKKDYCVRCHGIDKEKDFADLIWYRLKQPTVNLSSPATKIEFFRAGNKVICGLLLEEPGKGFFQRRPDKRPGFHPSSMIPKLARACVNLSSVKPGQRLYDPFCGTGGMLIEAGMVGCKVIGSDLSDEMLSKAKKNLEHFKIKRYTLFNADATTSRVNCNVIVTDPPYGKASALYKKDRQQLYEKFLENAYSYLSKGSVLVMVLPTTIKFSNPFKDVKTIDYYVHHSMTRRIYVMKKH
jgi:tRNA (guanine10-N2)-dimethyltransferase